MAFEFIGKVIDDWYKATNPLKFAQRQAASQFRYRQAQKGRLRGRFANQTGSADVHLKEGDVKLMRERSRELDRDNLFASSILDRLEESVIGSGLGVTFNSPNGAWNKRASKLWEEWWNGTPESREMFSGGDLERLLFRSKKVDGDILVIKLNSGRIQIIEADRIQTPPDRLSDTRIVNGVEVDSVGKIIFYHVTESDDKVSGTNRKFTKIPASDAFFIAERQRVSMTRGVPVFVRNMDLFDDIDEFMNASIVQQKVSASHCMFIERKGGLDGIDGVTTETNSEGTQQQQQYIEAGTILQGEIGESAKMLGASQTGQQFGPFMSQLLRLSGLIYGMPLEILSLDFSQTSFSSARASLQVAQRSFTKEQRKFFKGLIEPIVRWKIRQFIKSGELSLPAGGYELNVTPPKMISIDPLKETNADILRVLHGFTTTRDVCQANGVAWKDILAQRYDEIIEAGKTATKVVNKTGEEWSSRDILGIKTTDAYAQKPEQTDPE
jgi:lambda family phage portal protein